MRQTTLSFLCQGPRLPTKNGLDSLMQFLKDEEDIAFLAVIPQGNTLKCISELLYRCSQYVPLVATSQGLRFSSCDPLSGRLIQVRLLSGDMIQWCFYDKASSMRMTLESSSLHAVFHQPCAYETKTPHRHKGTN